MKESSDWVELWDDDGRWYDYNSDTDETLKITDTKRLINKLAELLNNETHETSKTTYLRSQLPPLYTSEEIQALEILTDKFTILDYWQELDLHTVEEPKRVEVNKLINHPFNSGIYGESEDVTELANQIKISGWVKPLVINLKGEILGGNRRKLAIDLLAEQGHIIPEVDIEIKRFGSSEEELQFLILDNASREKTAYQKGREAQYLRMAWEAISAQKSSQLNPEQQWLVAQWESKKQELAQKKGTGKIKTRDVVGALTGMSGDQHRKLMKVMWLIDVLRSLERHQEAQGLINKLNKESITKAYSFYQEWEEENPTDYIYIGEKYGSLSSNDKVQFCHAMKDSDPEYAYVRLSSRHEAVRVLRKFLLPVEKSKDGELSKPKKKPKKSSNPKFAVGDRVLYKGEKGVIDNINPWTGFYSYEVTFDNESYGPRLRESDLIRDDSWNADDFGEIERQQEDDGQGVIFQEGTEEPPDPDDFGEIADYEESYKKWKSKTKSKKPHKTLSIKDFKEGEFYSDNGSVARLLSKTNNKLVLQWLGMGDSPSPRGSDFYPTEGIEVYMKSSCAESLQPYRFDPFDPPRFVERKLQKGDLVCPKWNKHTGKGKGSVIGYCDGLVIYQEDSGEEHRLSEDKLVLLVCNGFSLDDKVIRLIPDFPWQPQSEGRILALYSSCCDVKFEGFDSPCRLMYAWIDRAARQLDPLSEDQDESNRLQEALAKLQDCSNEMDIIHFVDSDLFESLDKKELKDFVKHLWVQLSEEKF